MIPKGNTSMKLIIKELEKRQEIILNVKKFDVSNMQEIKKEIQERLKRNLKDVSVNLSSVEFIDSSGLSVLIAIFKQLKSVDKELTLCGLQEQPMELLEITQLHKVFTLSKNCNN